MAAICTHLYQIKEVTPAANGCVGCLASGDTWVELRVCMSCGYVPAVTPLPTSTPLLTLAAAVIRSFSPTNRTGLVLVLHRPGHFSASERAILQPRLEVPPLLWPEREPG